MPRSLLSYSSVRLILVHIEQRTNLLCVGTVHKCCVVEVAFTLFRLLREDVAVISVFSLNLTSTGQSETLLGGTIGLYLWHFFEILVVLNFYLGTQCAYGHIIFIRRL